MSEKRRDSGPLEAVTPEVLARFRAESDSRAEAANVAEAIVRAAAGPDRISCPCCGMPDAVTPERVVDYLRMALGADGQNTMPERIR